MPQFTLHRSIFDNKVLELANFIFQLYDESDFCACTKVSDNQEGDDFQERISLETFFVSPDKSHLLCFERAYLHDVAYVQILDPLSLVQKAEDMSQINILNCTFNKIVLIFLFLLSKS